MLDEYCFKSKNLYNFANYQIRQKFCSESKYISYNQMDKLLKQEGMNTDYRNMPTAQSAQQTLRLLDKNWKSFFKAIKDWSKHKEKYNGKYGIEFTGIIKQSEIADILKEASYFLYPNIYPETFGISVTEAINYNCLLIHSIIKSTTYLISFWGA